MAEGTKILFVDDVADWRNMLSGLLSDHGYEVGALGDREEAQQVLKEEPFALAILDKRLDETDEKNAEGLTLARYISENYPQMPVVILTGYGTQKDVAVARKPDERGKRLASAFVEKNRIEELPALVESILKGK